MPEDIKKQIYGKPARLGRASYRGKPAFAIFGEKMTTVLDMLGLCFSVQLPYGPSILARFLSAVTGIEMSPEEIMKAGDRVFTLQWAFNARQGITMRDLDFPARFYEEPIPDGAAKGDVLSRDKVASTMKEYYRLRGWDRETGLPTRERLEELGLEEVIQDLGKLGLLREKQ